MGKINKIWIVSLVTILAVTVFGVNVYSKPVIIDNVQQMEKADTEIIRFDTEENFVGCESSSKMGTSGLLFISARARSTTRTFSVSGTYRFSIYAPDNYAENPSSYAWLYSPPDNHYGGAICIYKNKDIPRDSYGYPMDPDYFVDMFYNGGRRGWFYHLDTPYPASFSSFIPAIQASKGHYIDISITAGDYLKFQILDGNLSDNSGGVTFKITAEVDYIKVFPDPAYVLVGKEQQFIVKGYSFGPNGVRDGDPDPETYEPDPEGDDTGPIDIDDVTWSTSLDETIGQINEETGFFQAGEEVGQGTVTATYASGDDELTDEVDVTVFKLESFLIRDKANYWNFIKHDLSYDVYRDHTDNAVEPERQQVVVAEKVNAGATVSLEVVTDPSDVADKMFWEGSKSQVNPQTGSFNGTGKALTDISSAGAGQEVYEISVGIDVNEDGSLDTDEVISTNKVRLLTSSHVKDNFNEMHALVKANDFFHVNNIASTNALIFLGRQNEANIRLRRPRRATVNRLESDNQGILLEHPVGADFSSANGNARVPFWRLNTNSIYAKKIADSATLKDYIEEDLEKHKDDLTPPDNRRFYISPVIEIGPFKIEFGKDHPVADFDLYFGFGKATVTYRFKAFVRRRRNGKLEIIRLLVYGTLEDLYDWDFYYDRPWDPKMASVQFAWKSPPSNRAGRIYKMEVKFRKIFRNIPFPE